MKYIEIIVLWLCCVVLWASTNSLEHVPVQSTLKKILKQLPLQMLVFPNPRFWADKQGYTLIKNFCDIAK